MGLLRTALLRASQSQWLAHQARHRRFARRAVARFMPGEDLDSALLAAQRFAPEKIASVLTQLGENVNDVAEAEAVAHHYMDVLERVKARSLTAHVSIKLTHLGLDLGREVCAAQLRAVVSRAAQLGNFVWIDMEGSKYTDVTLELYREARRAHPNVGVCLQAYLFRTQADLDDLLPLQPTIRLVKGAYSEPPNVAYPSKKDVDAQYLRLAWWLLDARSSQYHAPGFGTHDMGLIQQIRDYAKAKGVPDEAYEVQMLYGIRSGDQRRLAAEGARVRALISYGSAWFAWYMRRLAERPANIWFVVKSLFG